MKCLRKYGWVKLPRSCLPQGKGILGHWARLASRAAFRPGQARYCGFLNSVTAGMWAGGVVGLKSILGVKSRAEALRILDQLKSLGYLTYTLDFATKKLEYVITDWVSECSGAACSEGTVYATAGYGFLCLPRNIPDRLAKQGIAFEEADAWLDLWCHTVWQDPKNIFSHLAPTIQYNGAALTLETLGSRWGWEKTKVWRFFQKHGDVFPLYRLPGSCGCLIWNRQYPTGTEIILPSCEKIKRIFAQIRILAGNTHFSGSDHVRLNRMVGWYSQKMLASVSEISPKPAAKNRVALFAPILRAYFSNVSQIQWRRNWIALFMAWMRC